MILSLCKRPHLSESLKGLSLPSAVPQGQPAPQKHAPLTVNQTQSPCAILTRCCSPVAMTAQASTSDLPRLQEAVWGSGSVFPPGITPPHASQLELQPLLFCLGLSSASPGDAHCSGESLSPETQAEVPPDPTGELREHLGEPSVFLFWGQSTISFPRIA